MNQTYEISKAENIYIYLMIHRTFPIGRHAAVHAAVRHVHGAHVHVTDYVVVRRHELSDAQSANQCYTIT